MDPIAMMTIFCERRSRIGCFLVFENTGVFREGIFTKGYYEVCVRLLGNGAVNYLEFRLEVRKAGNCVP